MANDNDKEPLCYITSNITSVLGKTSIHFRNLIEALIYTFITVKLIGLIPFTSKVTMITSFCVGAVVFLLTVKGIKGQSPSEVVINTIKEHGYNKEYHMRCISDEEANTINFNDSFGNKSIADRISEKVTEKYREFERTGKIRIFNKDE